MTVIYIAIINTRPHFFARVTTTDNVKEMEEHKGRYQLKSHTANLHFPAPELRIVHS